MLNEEKIIEYLKENLKEARFVHSIGTIIAETETAVSLKEKYLKQVKIPSCSHLRAEALT